MQVNPFANYQPSPHFGDSGDDLKKKGMSRRKFLFERLVPSALALTGLAAEGAQNAHAQKSRINLPATGGVWSHDTQQAQPPSIEEQIKKAFRNTTGWTFGPRAPMERDELFVTTDGETTLGEYLDTYANMIKTAMGGFNGYLAGDMKRMDIDLEGNNLKLLIAQEFGPGANLQTKPTKGEKFNIGKLGYFRYSPLRDNNNVVSRYNQVSLDLPSDGIKAPADQNSFLRFYSFAESKAPPTNAESASVVEVTGRINSPEKYVLASGHSIIANSKFLLPIPQQMGLIDAVLGDEAESKKIKLTFNTARLSEGALNTLIPPGLRSNAGSAAIPELAEPQFQALNKLVAEHSPIFTDETTSDKWLSTFDELYSKKNKNRYLGSEGLQ